MDFNSSKDTWANVQERRRASPRLPPRDSTLCVFVCSRGKWRKKKDSERRKRGRRGKAICPIDVSNFACCRLLPAEFAATHLVPPCQRVRVLEFEIFLDGIQTQVCFVCACVRACVIACVRACVQPPATNKHTLVGKVAVWRKQLCCALFVLWIAKHSQRTKASVFLYDFRRTCCGKSRKGDPPRRPSCGCASARGSASPSTFIFPIIIFNKLWSNLYAEIQLQAACFKLHSSFVQIAFNMHSKCLQS